MDERFAGGSLDLDVWFPHYLPHWSSRAASAATWDLVDDGLRLRIPPDQPLWCPDLHDEPIRVSCIQSGSLTGQQPFREGLAVQEEQPTMWGYTPTYGDIEVRMRGTVTDRSMFAFWLSGIEDRPERSGEICVAEIFGDAVRGSVAEVGIGVKSFRDPALHHDFATVPLELDVSEHHTYGVAWRPGSLRFSVDGQEVRRVDEAPDYPVQLMIGVFDFPARGGTGDPPVPEVVVSRVTGPPVG